MVAKYYLPKFIWYSIYIIALLPSVYGVEYTDLMPYSGNTYKIGESESEWLLSGITTSYTDYIYPLNGDTVHIGTYIGFESYTIANTYDSSGIDIENVNFYNGGIRITDGDLVLSDGGNIEMTVGSEIQVGPSGDIMYTYNSSTVHHKYCSFGTNPNIGWGTNTLNSLTSGIANIAAGGYALQSVTTGTSNTAMGNYAGTYSTAITTGSKNTVMGDGSSVSSASAVERSSLGYRAIAQSDYSTQLGQRTVSSGSAATLYHRTQLVISEDDIGSGNGIVFCDNDGNYAAKKSHTNVNQATSITTGVTLNDYLGSIITVSTTLSAGSSATFTVTNSYAFDSTTYLISVYGYTGTYGTNGFPIVNAGYTGTDGQFDITLMNVHPSNALSGQVKISFMLIGGV